MTIEMLPSVIWLFFVAIAIGVNITKHGKTIIKKSNIIHTLAGTTIQIGLLGMGGFFACPNPFPIIVYIFMIIVSFCIEIDRHGKYHTEETNATTTFIAILIMAAIFWWGGFFAPLMGK